MFIRSTSIWVRACVMLGVVSIVTGMDVGAQSPSGLTRSASSIDPIEIKLGFFGKPWASVLKEVAEQSGLTLVMDTAPSGSFTRRDSRKYNTTEAVQILNRELTKKHFRLIVKGDFLVVLELKSARSQYYRNEVPATPEQPQETPIKPSESRIQRLERRFESIVPGQKKNARDVRTNRSAMTGIQQVKHEETAPAEKLPPVIRSLETNHSAKDLAQTIFRSYRNKSQLINAGPQGLPAFQVFDADLANPGEDQDVLFSIGIDVGGNRLAVEASPDVNRDVLRMIESLDTANLQSNQVLRLKSTTDREGKIAEKLRPTVRRMAFAQTGQSNPADPQQPQVPEQPQRPPTPNDPTSMILDSLRGDVDIEVVPGGLILKGNETDIEALMKVINQIEGFSQGAVPEIHLLFLKHVHSEAVAALLKSVYERLNQLQARGNTLPERIDFIPVVKPNAVLILAPSTDMESILQLADELDQPTDPLSEFEVFFLRHANASVIAQKITDFYGQLTPGQANTNLTGLSQRVTAVADTRSNSVVVRARPNDLDEVAVLIQKLDRLDSHAVSRVRMFTLKHAIAEELASVINTTIQGILGPPGQNLSGQQGFGGVGGGGTGQIPDELQEARSQVIEFLSDVETGQRLVRSGVLSDIRVSTDVRTNSLLITAPKESMELMESLVRKLDQPSSNIAEIKVFTLENGDATAMAELLQTLFDSDSQTANQNQQQLGVQIVGAEDASSNLIPLRFSVDVRTNTIVAIGGADALRVVEAILLRLDENDLRQRQSTVVKLKNAPVADVSTAINQFLTSQRELAQLDPDLVSNVELLQREVIVVPEPINNSLLISATPRYYEEIMKLVAKLDEAPAQVIIQALLVEVVLDNNDEFGVELGFQDSVLFNRSLLEDIQVISTTSSQPGQPQVTSQQIVSQVANPGFLFNAAQLGNNTAAGNNTRRSHVASQGTSSFSLGRTNAELGFGGLVLSASSDSVNVLIRALSAQRTVNILSRPQIRTLDNQISQIVVGQTIQWIQSFTQNQLTGGFTPVTQPRDVGIILEVTPRISPDGTIVMETRAEKSQVSDRQGVPLVFDPTTGTTIESPIIDVTIASTTVAVPNGQTAVIGGMITKTDSSLERKVPWLGDIPIIGVPFRFDSSSSQRTELLIFLTPRIIRHDEDAEMIKQIEAERMHFMVDDAESVHGPLFAIPSELQPSAKSGMQGQMTPPAPGVINLNDINTPSSSITPENAGRLMPVKAENNVSDRSTSRIQQATGRSVGAAPAQSLPSQRTVR